MVTCNATAAGNVVLLNVAALSNVAVQNIDSYRQCSTGPKHSVPWPWSTCGCGGPLVIVCGYSPTDSLTVWPTLAVLLFSDGSTSTDLSQGHRSQDLELFIWLRATFVITSCHLAGLWKLT